MNDMTPNDGTGTALALVLPSATELEAMLKAENGLDATLASLKAAAQAKVKGADPATAKGRELMKSAAYDISKSKTEIERRGKELTEQQRKEVAAVNAGIKSAAVYLDTVRDEIKRPAVEWEAAEAERKAKIAGALERLRNHGITADAGSAPIAAKLQELEQMPIGDDFGDQREQAEMVHDTSVRELRNLLAAAEKAEADARELEELRAMKAAQEAKEAEDQRKAAEEEARREEEARLAREAEELKARQEAEAQAAAADLANRATNARAYIDSLGKDLEKPFPVILHLLETDLVPRIDQLGEHAEGIHQLRLITLEAVKARAKIAERARADAEAQARREAEAKAAAEAEERAAREKADAEARHQRELEAAAQKERDRIAAEQQAEDEARAKRVADQAHRSKIRDEIATDLNGFVSEMEAYLVADALMAGAIRNCEVKI